VTALLCDYDDSRGGVPCDLIFRIRRLVSLMRWTVEDVRIDKTAHGHHVIVRCAEEIPLGIAVAAQVLLLSDPNREAHVLRRAYLIAQGNVPAFWARRANTLYHQHAHEAPR
jgi:hypothetical protein